MQGQGRAGAAGKTQGSGDGEMGQFWEVTASFYSPPPPPALVNGLSTPSYLR